jgi:nitrite reductase/ring-hydroxylating ferredoxin subunit/uncharacterized membrane protein
MLIPFPFAYLMGTACLDLAARARRQSGWSQTARHMRTLGLASAVIAAVPGLVDYLTAVPPRSSASKRATKHLLSNLMALGLFATAAARRGDSARPSLWTVVAEMAGAGLLAVGGWMGGTLVYRNQIAVDHRYAGAGRWKPSSLRPPVHEDGPVDLGSDDQLAVNQMKLLQIGDRRIALARTEEGYAAFDDRCTHRGGPLSDGSIACSTVQCPWHGSQFDVRTGTATRGPATSPVGTYEVSEAGGRIWMWLPRPVELQTQADERKG